jgi:hypothetical protein
MIRAVLLSPMRFTLVPVVFAATAVALVAGAAEQALELHCVAADRPLIMNAVAGLKDAAARDLNVTRLDLLLSGLQLRRGNGTWLSLPEWHGFFRGSDPSRRVVLPKLPAEKFSALRVNIGVGPGMNHGDPARLPAEHPLHPVTSGMHWGWASARKI